MSFRICPDHTSFASRCKMCKSIYNQQWRQNNPDYRKNYRRTNPEKLSAQDMAYRSKNLEKVHIRNKRWQVRNIDKIRNSSLRNRYNITLPMYNEMLSKQDNRCKICNILPDLDSKFKQHRILHVDHDHATNIVRGLLCNNCNHMLGAAKDNSAILRSAATYIDLHVRPPCYNGEVERWEDIDMIIDSP